MKAKSKFYAVRQGRRPGIYSTWKDCSAQVNQHQGAVFKSFATFSDAQAFLLPSGGAAAPVETLQPSTSTNGQSSIAIKKSTFQFFTQSIAGSSSSLAVKDTSLSNADDQILSIWTDGACRGNGTRRAKAGYGVYFGPKDPRNLSEKLEGPVQTNNRAELTAVIRAIECSTATHSSSFPPLRIHTDSTYVKNGIEVWMNNWKRNGWKNKTGQPVANQDLWQQLDALNTRSSSAIQYVYVRGHSGDAGNEAADRLAVQGSEL